VQKPVSIFEEVVSSTFKQDKPMKENPQTLSGYKDMVAGGRGGGGGADQLSQPAQFPARQRTMTGIEIKREGHNALFIYLQGQVLLVCSNICQPLT
jgi:hypothetical protein